MKLGILDESDRNQYLSSYNSIANLQLIQETQNLEKNATPFVIWLTENYKDSDLNNYKNLHYIPSDNDLTMIQFMDFYTKRRAILKEKLMNILSVDRVTVLQENKEEIIEEELV